MAITITTTYGTAPTAFTSVLRTFYETTFLKALNSNFVLYNFATRYPIAKGFGPLVQFSRYATKVGSHAATASPGGSLLTEGVVPVSDSLTLEKVNATTYQYGKHVSVSDWLMSTHMSGYSEQVEAIINTLGIQAQDVIDQVCREALGVSSGAYVTYATGAASVADVVGNPTGCVMTAADVRRVVRTLKKRFVPFYDQKNYIGIIGPGSSFDLQTETGVGSWIDISKYTDSTKAQNGEVGKMYSVRFVESQNLTNAGGNTLGTATPASNGTTQCYFFGKDALGVVDITQTTKGDRSVGGGDSMKHIDVFIKEPGSAGTADPLEQIGTIGYKFNLGAVRLDDKRVQQYETGEMA